MATLGNSTVTQLRVINDLDVTKIYAPTASNGTTLGAGSNGQVLTSNGTSVYWKTPSSAVSSVNSKTGAVTLSASDVGAATSTDITNAINALDGNLNSTTPGASKTLTAFSQTNGVVSATFGNISITKSQVSDLGTIGAAAAKAVDTSISAGSTSTNLPTSAAVAAFVEGKGYKTTDNNTTYSMSGAAGTGTDAGTYIVTLTPSTGAATTAKVPAATSSVAGITKVGASGGAAAYSHTHSNYVTKDTKYTFTVSSKLLTIAEV